MKKIKNLFLIMMAVVLFAALSVTALADDDTGLSVSKTATVNEDGSYTIELEAYATGSVTTTTETTPCDVVLVLDLSSSMDSAMSSSDSTKRMKALVDAVNTFLEQVAAENEKVLEDTTKTESDCSTVMIVGFNKTATNIYSNGFTVIRNNNLNVNSVYGSYTSNGKTTTYTTTKYGTSGEKMTLSQGTRTDLGMRSANEWLANAPASTTDNPRNKVVVLFTDGYPSTSSSDNFDPDYAKDAVNYARTAKTYYNANVFTVAVLSGATPSTNPVNGYNAATYNATTNTTTASSSSTNGKPACVNMMLHAISSNYPNATATKGTNSFSVSWGDNGKADGGKYLAATSAEELKNIFNAISKEAGSTTSTLGTEAVMKDIVSSSFTLPDGTTPDNIGVSIIPWDSTTHAWSETVKYSTNEWKTQTAAQNYKASGEENVSVTISEDGKTLDITGFDYSTHFLATSDKDKDKDGVNDQSAKIVVSFLIYAKPSAVTGGSVATNGVESGIYENAEAEKAVIYFPVPEVTFKPVTYVVDYVTSDTSATTDASTIELDYGKVLATVDMLDNPEDDILKGEPADKFGYTIYHGKYGTISFGKSSDDADKKKYVRYAPTTMNWDDYDRIFVKGQSVTDSDLDVWAMLAVIPANNVYYEDTYITQPKTVEKYGDGENIEIKYTGITYSDGNWSLDGTEGNNQTQNANEVQGWVDGLADDGTYSNGAAHVANTSGATASFTFSGTGVDIYSRTNGTTGTILVTLRNSETGKLVSAKIIDNKAASGDYYQIPTCTFTDLTYGKYDVTIRVTTGAQKESRMTYYLDGVRIYNPIKPHEDDALVQEVYTEENLGAVFTEVRSLLVDSQATMGSAVFIDELTGEDGNEVHATTDQIADYVKDGPKAEVYLSQKQSVSISVEDGHTYYIGLKEITGSGTSVSINAATLQIKHTSDLYYKCIPTEGAIVITNTGEGILSVTKLRTTDEANSDTNADNTSGITSVPTENLLMAYRSISALTPYDYYSDVLTEEEAENSGKTSEEAEEDEETSESLDEDDITITNPTPTDDDTSNDDSSNSSESESPNNSTGNYGSHSSSMLSRLLVGFMRFFRR